MSLRLDCINIRICKTASCEIPDRLMRNRPLTGNLSSEDYSVYYSAYRSRKEIIINIHIPYYC